MALINRDYPKRWELFDLKTWSASNPNHPDRLLLKKIVKEPPILDVGCGPGLDSIYYEDYTGCDVTPKLLSYARKRYGAKNLVLCDARCLPFRNKAFKTAYSKGLVIHYPQNEGMKMLFEILRVASKVYIAWGILGRNRNFLPTYDPYIERTKPGFYNARYDLAELEEHFKITLVSEGTSVTSIERTVRGT